MNELNIDFIEEYNRLFDIIEQQPNSKSRNSIRNANRHLKKAWEIRDIDLAMSAFRVITAVEEAATSIIYAFQEVGYENSDKLKGHVHWHKAAVSKFFKALESAIFDPTTQNLPKMSIKEQHENGKTILRTAFRFEQFDPTAEWLPFPPLEFEISVDGRLMAFSNQFLKLTKDNGYTHFRNYLDKLANKRNRILYASDIGCPEITHIEPRLYKEAAIDCQNMAIAYLLISQHKVKQQFVQQCLNSILVNVDLLNSENIHPEL